MPAKKKAEPKPKYACGICGMTLPKHHKHCPVPKLTKNQVNWMVDMSMKTGSRIPLY